MLKTPRLASPRSKQATVGSQNFVADEAEAFGEDHAPSPTVRDSAHAILPEDDSLAENMQQVALHPLDQFHPFVALRDKVQTDAEIAATLLMTPRIVR
jgi:hypothetical protein